LGLCLLDLEEIMEVLLLQEFLPIKEILLGKQEKVHKQLIIMDLSLKPLLPRLVA
jgi:hypothetical protein